MTHRLLDHTLINYSSHSVTLIIISSCCNFPSNVALTVTIVCPLSFPWISTVAFPSSSVLGFESPLKVRTVLSLIVKSVGTPFSGVPSLFSSFTFNLDPSPILMVVLSALSSIPLIAFLILLSPFSSSGFVIPNSVKDISQLSCHFVCH